MFEVNPVVWQFILLDAQPRTASQKVMRSPAHLQSCAAASASSPWPATFLPTITVMFWLETENSFCAYAWPLWFVCCGSVVTDVIYATVENPRSFTDQRPEAKHVGSHRQFVKRGKILFPAGNASLGRWTQATSQSSSSVVKWELVMHKPKPHWHRFGGQGRFSKAASMCRRRFPQPGLLPIEPRISWRSVCLAQ